jgi:hypothetical protein
MVPNLTPDQQADPLYIMAHDAANASRPCVQKFLAAERVCASAIHSSVHPGIGNPAARLAAANWAAFPYKSTGSKLTDWEAFYTSVHLEPHEPFLVEVFTLLLLGVS